MTNTKLVSGLFVSILVLLFVIVQADTPATWEMECNGRIVIEAPIVYCYEDEEATPTPTAEATATATAVPTATNTPQPSPTPSEDPVEPYPDAAPCEHHDPVAWHGIWDHENVCHHDHEHGDNPAELDHLFGPLGSAWGGEGIDHPFHTPGEHSEFAHQSHKVTVRSDMPCTSVNGSTGCVTNVRILHHLDLFNMATRFHSAYIEMEVCSIDDPTDCGIVQRGGHIDFGPLIAQNLGIHVPVDDDTALFPLSSCGSARRLHRTDRQFAVWYGFWHSRARCLEGLSGTMLGRLQLGSEVNRTWGPLDVDDPYNPHIICPDGSCVNNSALREQAHLIDFDFNSSLAVDGRYNLSGYTTQYGILDPDCTEPGPECVPFVLDGVPDLTYQYRDGVHAGTKYRQYDILFDEPYSGWIKFPN
jgi:hypothetical protein